MKHNKLPSYTLTENDAINVWHMYWDGEYQNRIAAEYDVNPGRINEVIKERNFLGSQQKAKKSYNGNKPLN